MAYYVDLSPCDYFVEAGRARFLKSVGWLECNKPYTKGEVSEMFFLKLCQLIQNPFYPPAWPIFMGYHSCTLCKPRFTAIVEETYFQQYKVRSVDKQILLVPSDGFLYLAPIHIAHYVDAHEYQPPAEFCQAVMDCPEMRSMAYLKALLENGGRQVQLI